MCRFELVNYISGSEFSIPIHACNEEVVTVIVGTVGRNNSSPFPLYKLYHKISRQSLRYRMSFVSTRCVRKLSSFGKIETAISKLRFISAIHNFTNLVNLSTHARAIKKIRSLLSLYRWERWLIRCSLPLLTETRVVPTGSGRLPLISRRPKLGMSRGQPHTTGSVVFRTDVKA